MPSVKLIMFTSATNQRTVSGYWARPRSPTPTNGRVMWSMVNPAATGTTAQQAWPSSLTGGLSPQTSSRAPRNAMRIAPTISARACVSNVGQVVDHRHEEAGEDREPAQARRRRGVDAAPLRLGDRPDGPREACGQRGERHDRDGGHDGADDGDQRGRHERLRAEAARGSLILRTAVIHLQSVCGFGTGGGPPPLPRRRRGAGRSPRTRW